MNAASWQELQACGVMPDTELVLDFSFDAPGEERARELAAALQEKGHQASASRGGSLFRRVWHVEGSTPPLSVTLDRLNKWVREMVAAGQQCECDFDGWGAAVPGR
jgi:hypothetical protein